MATGTGLVSTGWENSLGLTRKGPSKDLGQDFPLLNLSLPNPESEFNLIHYHLGPSPLTSLSTYHVPTWPGQYQGL